eukprot:CAMPEP_0170606838 /NCGR_PEP_ID=MMETSP0224-20130122/20734_1 /TAXON_ID=285029 /ORGANISM="Togula jolla, Strain CCCM 725" /LENGTH=116 /DNA_ID=CAMNT_0010931963 /DNA_START=586 /DNA_END=936 /DNA_ORIENTATION=-
MPDCSTEEVSLPGTQMPLIVALCFNASEVIEGDYEWQSTYELGHGKACSTGKATHPPVHQVKVSRGPPEAKGQDCTPANASACSAEFPLICFQAMSSTVISKAGQVAHQIRLLANV